MNIEIDQSGRVEYTSHKTVIADSCFNSVYISAKDKRTLQMIYRELGFPREFTLIVFTALLAVIISKTYQANNNYIIDEEYLGLNKKITDLLLLFLTRLDIRLNVGQISFKQVGKKSQAHINAYKTFKAKNQKVLKRTSVDEILLITQPKKRPGC